MRIIWNHIWTYHNHYTQTRIDPTYFWMCDWMWIRGKCSHARWSSSLTLIGMPSLLVSAMPFFRFVQKAWNEGSSMGFSARTLTLARWGPWQAPWSLFPQRQSGFLLQELPECWLHQPQLEFTEDISLAPRIVRSGRTGNSAETKD